MEGRLRMRFGYTANLKSVVTKGICFATKGEYAHSIIIFEWLDDDGNIESAEYYESRSVGGEYETRSGDWIEIESGVRGPIDIDRLYAWRKRDPENHKLFIHDIAGLTSEDAHEAILLLDECVGQISYAKLQIVKNAKFLLFGLGGFRQTRSPKKWTCSETQINCLPDRIYRRLGCGPVFTADESVPSGQRGEFLGNLELINDWNKRYKEAGGLPCLLHLTP